jgi:hypothetical protein
VGVAVYGRFKGFAEKWLYDLIESASEQLAARGEKERSTALYATITVLSGLTLFLELVLIRWQGSLFPVFALYKNFTLLACPNVIIMVPVAQFCGHVMLRANTLAGYGCNLLGSIAGVGLLFVLSWLWTGPVIWFAVAVALVLAYQLISCQALLERTHYIGLGAAIACIILTRRTDGAEHLFALTADPEVCQARRPDESAFRGSVLSEGSRFLAAEPQPRIRPAEENPRLLRATVPRCTVAQQRGHRRRRERERRGGGAASRRQGGGRGRDRSGDHGARQGQPS